MAKIINKEQVEFSELKLIGLKYGSSLNGYGSKWQEWFEKDLFSKIENLKSDNYHDDSYIGLMKWEDNNYSNYEYWIGVFKDVNTEVPEGFESIIIPKSKALVYYIKGVDGPELYGQEGPCFNDMLNNHFVPLVDKDKKCYAYERYNCPRFTSPDENGEVILDYVILVK